MLFFPISQFNKSCETQAKLKSLDDNNIPGRTCLCTVALTISSQSLVCWFLLLLREAKIEVGHSELRLCGHERVNLAQAAPLEQPR